MTTKIFLKNLLGLARKLRSKEATWSKNENSVNWKKKSDINYLLLWPNVNFCLKIPQNWDLPSKIQGFESLDWAPLKPSNSWISDTNLNSELFLGGNWPLVIKAHNWYKFFFIWPNPGSHFQAISKRGLPIQSIYHIFRSAGLLARYHGIV